MNIHLTRVILSLVCCSFIAVVAGVAQKKAPKPDDWPMQNAMIGPDSPIEIRAGSFYQAQAMYPVPDGPLFPLKANVTWSIESGAKGISIGANTGMINVEADVPHGTSATVLADIDNGRRKLSAKVYVFRPEENPLIGAWHVDTRVACGEAQEIRSPAVSPLSLRGKDWKFHVSQQFWVGKELNIAAGVRLAGTYELNVKAAKITLAPTWPKKPVSTWNYFLKSDGKALLLMPLEPQEELEPGCGYILLR
jgi:hypothetical protein